jgi:hypothetical protein
VAKLKAGQRYGPGGAQFSLLVLVIGGYTAGNPFNDALAAEPSWFAPSPGAKPKAPFPYFQWRRKIKGPMTVIVVRFGDYLTDRHRDLAG